MLFKRLNRDTPEQVYIVVQNNEGSALVAGSTVQLEMASASVDGVKARVPDTANLYAFLGLADAAIADQDFGLVQVYGYRSGSVVWQSSTSMATGEPLAPSAGNAYLVTVASSTASNAAATQQPIFGVLAESIASSSASTTISAKVFLRAL